MPSPAGSLGAALVVLACACAPLLAQETVQTGDSSIAPAAADSLIAVLRSAEHHRTYLRLTMRSQSTYSGYVFRVEPDSGWAHIAARRATLTAITRVEQRFKERSGALIGSILGAVALGWLGYEWDDTCHVYDPDVRRTVDVRCDAGWPLGLGGFLTGAVLGAVAGIAIDPGVTRWEDAWREPVDER